MASRRQTNGADPNRRAIFVDQEKAG